MKIEIILIVIICVFALILLLIRVRVYLRDLKLLKSVTQPNRGTRSERELVLKLLKNNIPSQTVFHDLYLSNQNGTYTQIDLVVATRVGIIVFEVKDYSGWIFGTGDKKNWTQVLAYGQVKYLFYNPILQNQKHVFDLSNKLPQFDNVPFYSVVVFFGDSEFKNLSQIPNDVFLVKDWDAINAVEYILSNNLTVNYIDKREIVNTFMEAVKNGEDEQIRQRHILNVMANQNRNR